MDKIKVPMRKAIAKRQPPRKTGGLNLHDTSALASFADMLEGFSVIDKPLHTKHLKR